MERVVVYGAQHSPAALGRYHVPPTIVNFIQDTTMTYHRLQLTQTREGSCCYGYGRP